MFELSFRLVEESRNICSSSIFWVLFAEYVMDIRSCNVLKPNVFFADFSVQIQSLLGHPNKKPKIFHRMNVCNISSKFFL